MPVLLDLAGTSTSPAPGEHSKSQSFSFQRAKVWSFRAFRGLTNRWSQQPRRLSVSRTVACYSLFLRSHAGCPRLWLSSAVRRHMPTHRFIAFGSALLMVACGSRHEVVVTESEHKSFSGAASNGSAAVHEGTTSGIIGPNGPNSGTTIPGVSSSFSISWEEFSARATRDRGVTGHIGGPIVHYMREGVFSGAHSQDDFIGVRLVGIADDGTTTILVTPSGPELRASVGGYFISPEFGTHGLRLISASAEKHEVKLIRRGSE